MKTWDSIAKRLLNERRSKSMNIATFPLHNSLFIMGDMITYNLSLINPVVYVYVCLGICQKSI